MLHIFLLLVYLAVGSASWYWFWSWRFTGSWGLLLSLLTWPVLYGLICVGILRAVVVGQIRNKRIKESQRDLSQS